MLPTKSNSKCSALHCGIAQKYSAATFVSLGFHYGKEKFGAPLQRQLTPRSRVFLEKLTRPELVKKFLAIYGTRKFNIAFTRARHLSLY
jgi:hypothetical protein